jgi:predicted glycogen debranching enzyme
MPGSGRSGHDVSELGLDGLIAREWLVPNGLGGYASSTIAGLNTRKYHGLLVASMAPPVRRMVLLSRVEETISLDGSTWPLASSEYPGSIYPRGFEFLRAFSHDPFPRWAYQADGWTIEKTLQLVHGQNTVCLSYTLLGGTQPIEFELRPMLALRPIHELMFQWNGRLTIEKRGGRHYRVAPTGRTPEVFFAHDGSMTSGGKGDNAGAYWYLNTIYRREQERGYAGLEDVWSPAAITWTLHPGETANFVCSADPIDFDRVLATVERQAETAAMERAIADIAPVALKRAATEFLVELPPVDEKATSTVAPATRAVAISGFPWPAPAMRDVLIGFTGLYLVTGRHSDGLAALRAAASTLRDGLLASHFPEDGSAPLYRGADVSLWFINAVRDYLRYTKDNAAVIRHLLEPVLKIIATYVAGTRLGITSDCDYLLSTREAGSATTWMDAQSTDWVVTPRQGKPVELNALWYNALCIAADLCDRADRREAAGSLRHRAAQVKTSFNKTFWSDDHGYCYDVIESTGIDPSLRPNQLLAISLPHAVLNASRHTAVLDVLTERLLTPFGLRTLAPQSLCYQGRYGGDVIARDGAQHNGSVYPWLLGHYATAYARVHGRTDATRRYLADRLQPCVDYTDTDGLGHLPELFDGDAPHHPGGAIASAASAAEVLRAWVEDVQNICPALTPATPSTWRGRLAHAVGEAKPSDS